MFLHLSTLAQDMPMTKLLTTHFYRCKVIMWYSLIPPTVEVCNLNLGKEFLSKMYLFFSSSVASLYVQALKGLYMGEQQLSLELIKKGGNSKKEVNLKWFLLLCYL